MPIYKVVILQQKIDSNNEKYLPDQLFVADLL